MLCEMSSRRHVARSTFLIWQVATWRGAPSLYGRLPRGEEHLPHIAGCHVARSTFLIWQVRAARLLRRVRHRQAVDPRLLHARVQVCRRGRARRHHPATCHLRRARRGRLLGPVRRIPRGRVTRRARPQLVLWPTWRDATASTWHRRRRSATWARHARGGPSGPHRAVGGAGCAALRRRRVATIIATWQLGRGRRALAVAAAATAPAPADTDANADIAAVAPASDAADAASDAASDAAADAAGVAA